MKISKSIIWGSSGHAKVLHDVICSHHHACKLARGVYVTIDVILCRCVKAGENIMISAGAVVLLRVSIGSDVIIGACAIVTKSVVMLFRW